MSYGININGFKRKMFEDIKADLQNKYREIFGNIRLDDNSVFGQLIAIQTENLALMWEQLEDIYNSFNPDTAEGIALDYLLALNGLERLKATYTTVWVGVDADNNTVINDNFTVGNGIDTFVIDGGVTVDYSNVYRCYFKVLTAEEGEVYTININGTDYTYTAQPLETEEDIANGLIQVLQGNNNIGVEYKGFNTILIYSNNGVAFSVDNNADNKLKLYIAYKFIAERKGKVFAVAGDITQIIANSSTGINGVFNFEEGLIGRDTETDEEARLRRAISIRAQGNATIEAIKNKLLLVDDVTSVTVYENDTDNTVDNMPPHSIMCVVVGGNNQDIAEAIFNSKAAGIQTYGGTGSGAVNNIPVIDSMGVTHYISFARPEQKEFYIAMRIWLDDESSFPENGVEAIKDNIVEFVAGLEIGKDIIYQKLFIPVYNVGGIAKIDMGISFTEYTSIPDPIPESDKENLVINFNEYASINKNSILIEIVTN